MAPNQQQLPPWLRGRGAARRSRGATLARGLAQGVLALLVFGAGVGAGFYLRKPQVVAAPPAVCPTCAAAPVCVERPRAPAPARRKASAEARRPKAAPIALSPLPEAKPMDESTRAQALRAFAEQRAPELRDCVPEPDRGPPRNVGAAFEIDEKGSVESVQILGDESSPKDVRRCYSKRLKSWRFPQDLLRGEEKLLVNFVL